MRNNCLYHKNRFIDLLVHLGNTRDFAENGNKTFKMLLNKGCPDADTLLCHLKNYRDLERIKKMYESLNEIVWQMAKKTNSFQRTVDMAADFTEWLFYGDRSAPMVVGKEPKDGTTKCYKFASINIVESGERFTLKALPAGPFDNKEDLLREMLGYAIKRVRINRLYVDREFCDVKSIKLFNRLHIKYLMPCIRFSTVKKVMKISPTPRIYPDFKIGDTTFNLIIVEDKDGIKRAFATNEEIDENDENIAERLFELYGKRWGIETSYRVKKHTFLPKTTSKNYYIRLFYFLFAVLLYNLWIIADILLWMMILGKVGEKHLVTSKLFAVIFILIDPKGG
jgi:putative transposase